MRRRTRRYYQRSTVVRSGVLRRGEKDALRCLLGLLRYVVAELEGICGMSERRP